MHELSVTQSLIDMMLSEAEKAKADRITKVNIVVGENTGIVGDCVQFYFDILSDGTIANGAKLCFKTVPALFHCARCDLDYRVKSGSLSFKCPVCGESGTMIKKGNELYIENMEVCFDGDKSS